MLTDTPLIFNGHLNELALVWRTQWICQYPIDSKECESGGDNQRCARRETRAWRYSSSYHEIDREGSGLLSEWFCRRMSPWRKIAVQHALLDVTYNETEKLRYARSSQL